MRILPCIFSRHRIPFFRGDHPWHAKATLRYAELAELGMHVARLKIDKQNAERATVRQKMADLAKQHGFDIRELMDGRKQRAREPLRSSTAIRRTLPTPGPAGDGCRGGW